MASILSVEERISLLVRLCEHLSSDDADWAEARRRAEGANAWFTQEHIEIAANNIQSEFLVKEKLEKWLSHYTLPAAPRKVGIVMAGNIPLVGFHDFLCGFIAGHHLYLKLSSKDEVLMKYIVAYLTTLDPRVADCVTIADRITGCDAYIATGSSNTARYFEQYFGKFPNIIRQNRTSVAILDGAETDDDLSRLADDVYLYYGLGCRNVTQICVPEGYDFQRLLQAFELHNSYADLNKYKNNYDYHLAIYLLNRVPYMSNESLLMVENELPFSAVSVLHYHYYTDKKALTEELSKDQRIQAVVGVDSLAFGAAQQPQLHEYADGVDTMAFLCGL